MSIKREPDWQQAVNDLLSWYGKGHQDLPWREDKDPYHVWVSEIMLHQTRIEAVKSYYERFMKEFPDIRHLAEANEEKLLKLWEGLGYYNRVRNMKQAAVTIMEQYGGKFPNKQEDILNLKGIGSYTAGAIGSICFQHKVPAVDGNVLRVYSRLTGEDASIDKEKTKKMVTEKLKEVMPENRPGDFNEACMELGEIVCVPNGAPHCEECPWQQYCYAREEERWKNYPVKEEKKKRKIIRKTVFLIQIDEKFVLHKRDTKGLLAGLWEFPNLDGAFTKKQVLTMIEDAGWQVLSLKKGENAKHIFSHLEWHMQSFEIQLKSKIERKQDFGEEKVAMGENIFEDLSICIKENGGNFAVVEREQYVENYAVPSAFDVYKERISKLYKEMMN